MSAVLVDGATAAMAAPKKTGAGFARGKSPQDYKTPAEFIAAVKRKFKFDEFDWDLAATRGNSVAEACYYGPDHPLSEQRDALACDWARELQEFAEVWLNPPFGNVTPWVQRCAETAAAWRAHPEVTSPRLYLLVPASVGANWWKAYVHKKARVHFLNGRIKFDGKNGFPKDCALVVYSATETPGYRCWRWLPPRVRRALAKVTKAGVSK